MYIMFSEIIYRVTNPMGVVDFFLSHHSDENIKKDFSEESVAAFRFVPQMETLDYQ